jgi:hypothetical protein
MEFQIKLMEDIKELIRKHNLPRKCISMALVAIIRGSRVAMIALLLAGCSSKHDQVKEASESNENVTPPTGPICTQSAWATNGGIGGLRKQNITIPNYDASKGDSAIFQYKRWDATGWATFRSGFYSTIVFTVNQSVVTIQNNSSQAYDWQISAIIWTCN